MTQRIFAVLSVSAGPYMLLCKCSAIAEMGDRLATVDMDRQLGAMPLWGGGTIMNNSTQDFTGCFTGSRPSDHYFRSVCWFVCLLVQSFSQPSLIRF